MRDAYTTILEAIAEVEDQAAADAAVTKLIRHLESAGRMNALPMILRELRRIAARRYAARPRVEAASEGECAAALRAAAQEGITAPAARVNPALIRGWRAIGNGRLVDRSGKGALIDIYQKVMA